MQSIVSTNCMCLLCLAQPLALRLTTNVVSMSVSLSVVLEWFLAQRRVCLEFPEEVVEGSKKSSSVNLARYKYVLVVSGKLEAT